MNSVNRDRRTNLATAQLRGTGSADTTKHHGKDASWPDLRVTKMSS